MRRTMTAVAMLSVLAATPSLAETYNFTLHNESSYAITGFATKEDGVWSKWEGVSAAPGQSQPMSWTAPNAECSVPFKVIYKDVQTEEWVIDWCKVTNIHVEDSKVWGD